ncbi:MAG: GNAT family N-acetyltransferase [Candidatus Thorarchaeota archaeon]
MKILTIDDFGYAVDILTKYQEGINFPAPFVDMLRDAMKAERIKVCLTESNDNTPNGFGVIGKVSGQIHAIWVDDRDGALDQDYIRDCEKEIVEWCFGEIENPPDRIDFPKMTDPLKMEILRRGYIEYKRAGMSASREDFLENHEVSLPEGFALVPYQSAFRHNVAEVIAEAYKNHIDAIIYPEFFSSKEKALELLQKLEKNELGEFIEGASQVLLKGEEVIGICMIVKKEEDASISDIVISPLYQGRGLGKALLVNTVLSFFKSDDSINAINLAVTLSNPAKYLYEKTGFKIKGEFSAIIYQGNGVATN